MMDRGEALRLCATGFGVCGFTGSLLDTVLHVCYKKSPIRINNDHF